MRAEIKYGYFILDVESNESIENTSYVCELGFKCKTAMNTLMTIPW